MNQPIITVIIPVKNEERHLGKVLESLKKQTLAKSEFEIIVVDGGSSDHTISVAAKYTQSFNHFQIFYNPLGFSSAARNIGILHSRGKYILVIDGHTHLEQRDYLDQVIFEFAKSGADCLGRPQPLVCMNPTWIQKGIRFARESWIGHNPHSAIYQNTAGFMRAANIAVAYRRSVFHEIGLFDEKMDACEDVELNTRIDRAGLTCFFSPELSLNYHPRSSLSGLFKQMKRYGVGRARLALKHPSTISLPSIAPSLFLITLILMTIQSLYEWKLSFSLLITISIYFSILIIEALRIGLNRKSFLVALLPCFWGAIHLGFAYGYLIGLLGSFDKPRLSYFERGMRKQYYYQNPLLQNRIPIKVRS